MAALTYTLTNIKTRVRQILNETTAEYWSDAEIERMINDAQRDIAIKALCVQNIDTVSTSASTRTSSYSGYKPLYVEYSDKGLMKINPLNMGRLQTAGNAPQFWFQSGTNICWEPLPDAIYSTSVYLADYPSEMSTGSPSFTIPQKFCLLTLYYTLARCYEKNERPDVAAFFDAIYEHELKHCRMDTVDMIPDSWYDTKLPG